MRIYLFKALRVFVVLLFVISASLAELPTPADAFVESVGVNVHLNYMDSLYYKNFPLILRALQDLHVRHVRDGIHNFGSGTSYYYANHNALAAAGIHTDYVVSLTTPQSLVQAWPTLVKDMDSLEAANELDASGDANWISDIRTQLQWLHPLSKTLGVPLIGPSLVNSQWWNSNNSYLKLGDISPDMDRNNLHNYLAGFPPETVGWGGYDSQGHAYGSIAWNMDEAHLDGPATPIWTTENGYDVNITRRSSIPSTTYGIYMPRLVFSQWNAGIKRTYIYELADEPSTVPSLGLLTSGGTRRSSFLALSSLLGLLQDRGAQFTPQNVSYTISGSTKNVCHTLLQKRDGSLYLALWNGSSIYDTNNKVPLPVASQSISVTLPAGYRTATLYTYTSSWALQSSALTVSSNSVTLAVTSKVALLKLTP